MRCYLTPTIKVEIKQHEVLVWTWSSWNSHTAGGIVKLESSLVVSYKVKTLACDPAISLLGIHPREMKIYVQKNSCTLLFIAFLVMVASNWNISR